MQGIVDPLRFCTMLGLLSRLITEIRANLLTHPRAGGGALSGTSFAHHGVAREKNYHRSRGNFDAHATVEAVEHRVAELGAPDKRAA
jgi:hypothetical protein